MKLMGLQLNKFWNKPLKRWQIITAAVLSILLLVCIYGGLREYKASAHYDFPLGAAISESQDGAMYVHYDGVCLPPGEYDLYVAYSIEGMGESVSMSGQMDNDSIFGQELPAGSGETTQHFTITQDADHGRISFYYPESVTFTVTAMNISASRHMVRDGLFYAALAALGIPCVWIFFLLYENSPNRFIWLLYIAAVLMSSLPIILRPGLTFAVDTRFHMMRMEGIFMSMKDGQFPMVILPNWCNRYGMLGALYPSIFLYVPAFFRLCGMSMLLSYKLFLFLFNALGIGMAYYAGTIIFKKRWQAALAMALFALEYNRFYGLYPGGTFGGGGLANLFYPLVVAGIVNIFFGNRKKWYVLAIGLWGIVSAHVISAFVTCIALVLLVIVGLIMTANKRGECIISLAKAAGLFLICSVGNLTTFIYYYFSDWGKENLQWSDFLGELKGFAGLFSDPMWTMPIIYLLVSVGILVWSCAGKVGSVGAVVSENLAEYPEQSGCCEESSVGRVVSEDCLSDRRPTCPDAPRNSVLFLLLIVSFIMILFTTRLFPWRLLSGIGVVDYIMKMLQLPFRFMPITGTLLVYAVTDAFGMLPRKRWTYFVLLFVTAVFLTFPLENYFGRETLVYDEILGNIYSENAEDYLPDGTQSEWYSTDTGYISDESSVASIDYRRKGTEIDYTYTCSADGVYAEFPQFYYDGYEAVNDLGENLAIEKGDRNRVRVYLPKTQEARIVILKYHVPGFCTAAWIAELLALAVVGVGILCRGRKLHRGNI